MAADAGALLGKQGRGAGIWRQALGQVSRDRLALAGAAIVLVVAGLAILAPVVTSSAPTTQHSTGLTTDGRPQGIGGEFLLGTDSLGRDSWSRLVYGARNSLTIALLTSLVSLAIGIAVGGVSGLSLRAGAVLMRIVDLVLSLPALLLGVVVLAITRPSTLTLVAVMGVSFGAYLSRIVYSEARSTRERDFVHAAYALGFPHTRVLVRHVIPHVLPTAVVYSALAMAAAVQLEAALSFIGLGIQPPEPSWGNMIAEGQNAFRVAPRLVLLPGAAVMLTTLGFALVADSLRDALDPSLRRVGLGR